MKSKRRKAEDESRYKGRVLLTYGRSLMALSAAQVLDDRDIEVIGCDSLDLTVLQCSTHCSDYFVHADWEDDPDGFIDDLVAAARKYRPDDDRPYVLMPMFTDTRIIAEHAHRFDGLIKLAIPRQSSIDGVEPKSNLIGTAEAAGVRAPLTVWPKTRDEVRDIARDAPYPVLTKAVSGVGGRGIDRHDDADSLNGYFEDLGEDDRPWPVIQQMVDGEDYCFCALCDKGEIIAHMAYRNLRSFPRKTGAGVVRETVDDAPFLEEARKLLAHLNWDGVCEIDYRWTGKPDEKAWLIEVNARFWAGLFHSIASGVEFPWHLYQLTATGKTDTPRKATVGRKSKIPLLWLVSAAQEIAEKDDYAQRLSSAWQDLGDPLDETDPITRMGKLVGRALDAPRLVKLVKSVLDAGKEVDEAADDFIPPEDANAALGIMFIASSLIRHGELPPELKAK
ncbi:carboxylate--amine ligase [Hyphobacterium marinum]|uniref:ATP-grasp domain-containing protein n=1 Tax=Hyphobacterium marinum TaxID=3116574 RepID=A0ABU7LU13_9PROT|nr:ATP-grasp domain-containing protein [Hyphobacterium sp. Y6023]MEE2565048.1 ATP-grasp domain-containing protein [Hyphobacterium sp. Y6023]